MPTGSPFLKPGDLFYEHDQGVASAVWLVRHGLGKHPSVTIVDTAGTELEAQVEHLSLYVTRISFNAPLSGKAFFN